MLHSGSSGWFQQKIKWRGALKHLFLGLCAAVLTIWVAPGFSLGVSDRMRSVPEQTIVSMSLDGQQKIVEGRQHYQNGQFAAAIADWKQALSLFEQQRDRLNQSSLWSNLSMAHQQLGQWTEANQAIEQAFQLLPSLSQSSSEQLRVYAQALNNQGNLQLGQGKAELALTSWQEASRLYEQLNEPELVTWSLLNQIQALRNLGFYQRANQQLQQLRQSLQAQPNSRLKVDVLLELGDTLRAMGEIQSSQEVLLEGLQTARTLKPIPNLTSLFVSLGNTARFHKISSTPEEPTRPLRQALDYYQQALNQAPVASRLPIQINQLRLLIELEQDSEAQALWQQLQPQLSELPVTRSSIYSQIHLVQGLMTLQARSQSPGWSEMAQVLAQAVQQSRALADQRVESYALGYLGQLYEKNHRWSEAQKLTERALQLAQLSNATDISYRWQWQLGRLLKAQADETRQQKILYPQAIAAYSEAITTLKALRSDLVVTNSESQFSFRESVEPVYRELVSLLLEPNNPSAGEKNLRKAREVIESLQVAELDNFFREACLTIRPEQVDQVDPNSAVIYPIILPNRLEVILSLPNQPLLHYSTRITQEDLKDLIAKMQQSMGRISLERERLNVAGQIYDALIRPLEADLQQSRVTTLAFVLDGSFKNIPMAALYDGQKYLLEKYSLALTPSLQLMEPKPLAQQKVAALMGGLSESRETFSALPAVENEIQQIQSKLPAKVLFNQTFTATALQEQIVAVPFPILHLATHGQFSSNAEETFILTWDQRLTVKQLGELLRSRSERNQSPIELLVLSACQTADGDERAALGLAGVAVRSGARSTLATLWPVNDKATSILMAQFYKLLSQGGLTKAEALRQAQLLLLEQSDFRHPYFWAPFVLIGNWL